MPVVIRAANALLMIAMPLVLGVALTRRVRASWGLFGVGALTFLGSQVLHLPFNAWVLSPVLERLGLSGATQGGPLLAVAVMLGLSAGVFEEGARAVVYARWLKTARRWREGVMFGAGHGGLEAIISGALALYALIQALALQGADLASVVPADRLDLVAGQVEAYWAMPWHLAFLGAVERAGAMCLHLGLAVLVLQAFRRRSPAWWLAAVAWHALVNALAVFALSSWGPYAAEAVVVVAALLSVALVLVLRRDEGDDAGSPAPPVQAGRTMMRDRSAPETRRGVEDSRFSE
jgi:uncharacterized membrane protein YhfC